jgi:hypothetical protein
MLSQVGNCQPAAGRVMSGFMSQLTPEMRCRRRLSEMLLFLLQ